MVAKEIGRKLDVQCCEKIAADEETVTTLAEPERDQYQGSFTVLEHLDMRRLVFLPDAV